MTHATLTPALAAHFAETALGHIRREYPHKLDHVMTGPQDARTPRMLHPVFFGSFDWHSCVHSATGCWRGCCGATPGPTGRQRFVASFESNSSPQKIAAECAYLAAPDARGFERPYGWGWLMKLAEELAHHGDQRWSTALAPLADVFARRFRDFLPIATYPVRVGAHPNTAFALRMAADYADEAGDAALTALLRETAQRWYGGDAACPAWGEPSGDDFLSSALIEAECMRRLLPAGDFLPLVRSLPSRSCASGAGDAVLAGARDRQNRREDRASRRPQS